MNRKMVSGIAVLLAACSTLSAQVPIRGSDPNIQLKPASAKASSVYPPEDAVTYVPENLLDLKDETAWFGLRDDPNPRLTFTFPVPVRVQAIIVKNGWLKDVNNWSYNSRVRDLDISASGGTRFTWTLRDDRSTQILSGLPAPTPSIEFSILSSYTVNPLTGGKTKYSEIGLTEVGFLGRIPDDKAIRFRDMTRCTLEFLQPVTIGPNETKAAEIRSDPVTFLSSGPMERTDTPGYQPRGYSMSVSFRASSPSPNERVVKPGRKFAVVNVVSRPDRDLTLVCDDGTNLVLTTREYGSPYGAFGELNMTEINYLFEGRLRFLDAKGKQTVDY